MSVYIPEHEDLGNLAEQLRDLITAPCRRVGRKYTASETPPFEVVACSWEVYPTHPDWGKDECLRLLGLAVKDLADYLNTWPEVRFYPITKEPPLDLDGFGYFDWKGASQPLDIRLVVTVEPRVVDSFETIVVKFHLATLVEKNDNDPA